MQSSASPASVILKSALHVACRSICDTDSACRHVVLVCRTLLTDIHTLLMSQPADGSPRTAPATAPAAFEPQAADGIQPDARARAAMSMVPALDSAPVRSPSAETTRTPMASSRRAAPHIRSASASRTHGRTPQQPASFNGRTQRARSREAGERAVRGGGDKRVATGASTGALKGASPTRASPKRATRGTVALSGGSKAAAARVSVML